MSLINLKELSRSGRTNCEATLKSAFSKLKPVSALLNLGNYFQGSSEIIPVDFFPTVGFSDAFFEVYDVDFSFQPDPDFTDAFYQLIFERPLTKEYGDKLREIYGYTFEDDPSISPDEAASAIYSEGSDTLFELSLDLGWNLAYRPEDNCVYSDNLYSGDLRRQGLTSALYHRVFQVVDRAEVDFLEIQEIVEPTTSQMFYGLRRSFGHDDSRLIGRLNTEYVRSPFFKLFDRLGFRDMEITTVENGLHISSLKGKKSDNLQFRLSPFREH